MKKKGLIIEIIILITIIASVITIYFVYKDLSQISPDNSNSNEIKNYSKNRKHQITKNIEDTAIYKIPLPENILKDNSNYYYYLNSTDGLIVSFEEEININYLNDEFLNENTIINFCNSYNDINSDYTLKCTYHNYILTINNIYYLKNIFTNKITTKKYSIPLDFKYEDKLDTYLNKLQNQNIEYNEIY